MKLTNQTILLIGNELPLTSYLVQHFSKLKNKIVVMSYDYLILNKFKQLFPHLTLLHLNFYVEEDRLKLVEELNSRYLSPSCIIYNELSFTSDMFNLRSHTQFQAAIESFYIALTHLDECLLSFLETEADATVTYILPKLIWFNYNFRHFHYILKHSVTDYVKILNKVHPHIRFHIVTHPLPCTDKYKFSVTSSRYENKVAKFSVTLINQIENFNYPYK